MSGALTSPFAVAAVVLIVAGLAKLRSPAGAARALGTLGVGADPVLVRGIAIVEIALGGWAAIRPGMVVAAGVAGAYGGFAGLAWLLARRQASCGCFGEREHPASAVQSIVSAVHAATAG